MNTMVQCGYWVPKNIFVLPRAAIASVSSCRAAHLSSCRRGLSVRPLLSCTDLSLCGQFLWIVSVSIDVYPSFTFIVLLLRAKNNPNCSFCDKSMKLPRMTNLYKVNIFWYGAIPNLQPEPRYAHVKKWRIWPLHGNEAELKCLFLSLLWSTLPRFLAL